MRALCCLLLVIASVFLRLPHFAWLSRPTLQRASSSHGFDHEGNWPSKGFMVHVLVGFLQYMVYMATGLRFMWFLW